MAGTHTQNEGHSLCCWIVSITYQVSELVSVRISMLLYSEKKYTIFCALINYLVIVTVVLDLGQPVHLLEVGSNSAHGKE